MFAFIFNSIFSLMFSIGPLIFLASCSALPFSSSSEESTELSAEEKIETVGWNSFEGEGRWFQVHARFSSPDKGVHPFFDLKPQIDFGERTVNFAVINPPESTLVRGLDLVSGKLYGKFQFCPMQDVWGRDMDVPSHFPYTEGIIPRILDQLGDPQKIIVFGRTRLYKGNVVGQSFSVKVVGGVVEQYCPNPPCLGGKGWESRLVLLAVDPFDEDFKNVTTMPELKKAIDWEEAKAFMENAQGAGNWMDKPYPVYRIIGNIPAEVALRLASKQSKVFKADELNQIRRSCFRLYDHLWDKIGNLRSHYRNWEELRIREEEFESSRSIDSLKEKEPEIVQKSRLWKQFEKIFITRFENFHRQYGKHFQTCLKMVNSSSILYDVDRHWFFSHMILAYQLIHMGHYYDCWKESWTAFPSQAGKDENLKRMGDQLKSCTGKQINKMFPTAVELNRKLAHEGRRHFRYIEYDNGPQGTHQKMYSWILDKNNQLPCKEKKDSQIKRTLSGWPIFPADVVWKSLLPDRIESEGEGLNDLIY